MKQAPIVAEGVRDRSWAGDLLAALALGVVMTFVFARRDWDALSRLVLPDTDDMMRLAQVRDWLAGQAFNDWTQYRMAPPHGSAMHWSRINDFGIAALIFGFSPILGRHGAEVAAVIAYPGLLFCCYLFLSARIGRRLWGGEAALAAAALAAFAYPGTTVFLPGRVDHHGLQMVLIGATVLAVMRGPGIGSGLAAGLAVAFSLMVGLETAPQVAGLLLVLAAAWTVRGEPERARLGAFAAALGGATLLFYFLMRPTLWTSAYCDAFTPASSTGILAGSVALGVLAGATPWLPGWRSRLAAGATLGAAVLGGTLLAYPNCLTGPYGFVDPLLQREFLAHIVEANSVFQQPALRGIALGGLVALGSATSVWMIWRRPRRWPVTLPIASVVLISALVTCAQLRGVYLGAPAAAPVLAGLVVAARRRSRFRTVAVVGAWIASAGLSYMALPPLAVKLFGRTPPVDSGAPPAMICDSGDTLEQVDRLPTGVIMSPTNLSAYLIGATRHSVVGAGYHRNDAANVATYRYFLGTPDHGVATERAWKVDYVAFCPGNMDEIDLRDRFPDSLGAMLAGGRAPARFERVPLHGTRLRFYRVRR